MPGAAADEGLFFLTGRKLDSDSATTNERERHRHHLSIISLVPSIFPSLVRPSDVNRTRCSIFIPRSQRHSRRVAQNGLSERQPGDSRAVGAEQNLGPISVGFAPAISSFYFLLIFL